MSCERYKDLKIDDDIWVYSNIHNRIITAKVIGLEGRYTGGVTEFYNQKSKRYYTGLGVKFNPVDGTNPIKEDFAFGIIFADEKNERGVNFVGFLTKEEAKIYEREIIDSEINSLKNKMKELQDRRDS